MMDYNSTKKINRYCSRRKEIECVYLFGSLVSRRAMQGSDVDLGIILKEGISKNRYSQLCARYSVEIGELLGRNADVLILNSTGTFLRHHVLKTGARLYESRRPQGRSFEARALIEYFDFQPSYDLMMHGLMRKVKKA
jgi:predicted nucleotidyltransferase